jgi:superfamily II DNA or RNA helicase
MHSPLPLPGDVVWIRRRRWRVERAHRDRHVVRLDVAARDRRLTFLSPFDRVVSSGRGGIRGVRPQSAIARLAHLVAQADDARLPSAAVAANAHILPHQLEPAMAMLAGRSRILIADEVGLGKTIQAGLAIAEIVRREGSPRILVLAPLALRDQWADELNQRFRLACQPLDRQRLDAIAQAGHFGDNPWRRAGIWITSADFLKQPHVRDGLPPDPWDLVVIDEAHGVCGDSDRYELCHDVGRKARRLILLTATPHSGDDARFARLATLGSPADLSAVAGAKAEASAKAGAFTIFRRTRESLGRRPPRRVRWHPVALSASATAVLAALQAFESAVATRSRGTDQALLLLAVFRKRALSTMSALSQSIGRRLAWLGDGSSDSGLDWIQPRLMFEPEMDDDEREEREGLTASSGLTLAQERSWLRRLRALADEASHDDRKVERLVALIHRCPEPVVVFTEFRDSLDAIEQRLRFSRPASILHGGLDQTLRRQQLRNFLDGTTSILLATDVAGQGLNLQTRARWVVSLELPWNPARLEQRIGRVDRISQTRPTHLTLLIARHDMESGLLRHLSRRVLAARRALSADVLGVAMPSEAHVRTTLLRHDTMPDAPVGSPPITICRRWERSARCAAKALRTRRALAGCWRATDALSTAVSCTGRVSARLMPGSGTWLIVCSVPLFDASDRLVERRIVPIAVDLVDCAADAGTAQPVIDAAKSAAVLAVARRVRQLNRRARAVDAATAARERGILAAIRDELALGDVQPGLFDLREARAAQSRWREHERLDADTSRGMGALTSGIRAGEPAIDLILRRR